MEGEKEHVVLHLRYTKRDGAGGLKPIDRVRYIHATHQLADIFEAIFTRCEEDGGKDGPYKVSVMEPRSGASGFREFDVLLVHEGAWKEHKWKQ